MALNPLCSRRHLYILYSVYNHSYTIIPHIKSQQNLMQVPMLKTWENKGIAEEEKKIEKWVLFIDTDIAAELSEYVTSVLTG